MIAPEIERLSGLFDDSRMSEALEHVRTDQNRFSPRDLGQALISRIGSALNEQDVGTLARVLAIPEGAGQLPSEQLLGMTVAKARALGAELEADLLKIDRNHFNLPRPALAVASLAGACAIRGYEPEQVFDGALSSPLEIPGILFAPALAIEVLFAYIDGGGLGPYVGRSLAWDPVAPSSEDTRVEVPALLRVGVGRQYA